MRQRRFDALIDRLRLLIGAVNIPAHLGAIRLKAILLVIELRFTLEHSQKELEAVVRRLPPGCRRVMHAGKTIGLLIPPGSCLQELRVKLHSALVAFEDYRMFGLSGETLCKNGLMDPIEDWMNDFRVPPLRPRKGPQPQHVPLTQRREFRR